MRARQPHRRVGSQRTAYSARRRRSMRWGIRSNPAWRRSLTRRRLCCLVVVALGMLLLPATALSATTAQIFPSFTGGKSGAASSLRFRYAITEPAGGVAQAPTQAVIHLPKGTGLNLAEPSKHELCSYAILIVGASAGPSACPKGSHAGPTGSAQFEAVITGKPTIVKAPVYPFIAELNGGTRALMLYIEGPPPFPSAEVVTVVPSKGGLVMSLGNDEISPALYPGVRSAIIGLSMTIGQNAKITPPKSCPGGGYAWSTDFSLIEGPDVTARATSACPAKGTAKSARPPAHAASAPTTQFQCEKLFHTSQGRAACFNRLPGSSCAHPLEVQKTDPNYRGDTKDFKLSLYMEPGDEEARAIYEYHPKPNVAICPYPMGAVFKVSLIYRELPNGWSEPVPEYNTKNIPEPTTRHGGGFEYIVTNHPVTSWYLVIKGYYVRPPWEQGR